MSISVQGEMIEMGDLEDEDGSPGFVLRVPIGTGGEYRSVTVKGLTRGELQAMRNHLFKNYTLVLEP